MRKFIVATIAALTLPVSAQAAGFINGGFEMASVNPTTFTTLNSGSTAINGWVVTGTNIDYVDVGYWDPAEGNRSIDLNGDAAGGIQQTFDTTEGKLYRVTFNLAGNPDGGPATKVMSTVASGNDSVSYSFNSTGKGRRNMGWKAFTYTFTAGGPLTTLSFTSSRPGAFGAALDLVSVSSGVPEPATWGLMILGFGAVGGAMRRRSTATAARLA